MKPITKIVLATAAVVTAGGVVVASAHADASGQGEKGYHNFGGKFGGRHGGRHGGSERMAKMFESFDANGDGSLTQEEIDTARAGRLAAFDANGDKTLALDEYQALWLAAMRERMVDRFQKLDADGDGTVTGDEFNRPFARMVEHADRNDDGMLDKSDRHHRGRHHDDDDDDHERRGDGPHRQGHGPDDDDGPMKRGNTQ